MLSEGVCCYGRHLTIAHVLYANIDSSVVNDRSSDFRFHNAGAGAYLHKICLFPFLFLFLFCFVFHARLLNKRSRFFSHDKMVKKLKEQKQKQKKAYFSGDIQSVSKHCKSDP